MKKPVFIILVLLILCFFSSCVQEDEDQCVNALDCPNGFLCLEGVCVNPQSNSGDEDAGVSDINNFSDPDVIDDSVSDQDSVLNDPDVILPDNNSDDNDGEIVDESQDADVDNAVDCSPGYHMEAEGDDENGDGLRGCVQNVACISEPCNNGSCTDLEYTVTCKCTTGYAGRWCTECDTGYLKSTVDEKCKPDCETGSYNCSGTKECAVDPVKNEAGCVCKEYYSGTECTTCDAAHFCNSHGTCSASAGSPVCTCYTAWAGDATCSTCTSGYMLYEGNCIEGCKYYCEATAGSVVDGYIVSSTSYGTCQIVSGNATCVCDTGWENPTLYGVIMGFIIPVCSQCDTDNPPSGGCPE